MAAPTALVTGGSGYFGSLLAAMLLERGYRVRTLDISDDDDRPAEIEFFHGDIRDPDLVARACRGSDVVFHNVAQVPLARDPEAFRSVNIGGTRVLVDAALQEEAGKVVYTSSSAVFGVPAENPVTEETTPSPAEAYGRAKYDGELVCRAAASRGLDVTIIRPRTILGHGRLGIFAILFDWISQGVDVFVLGDGSNRYQFVHADDLATACILGGERPGSETYNCGATRFGTMREALEGLVEHAGTTSRVRSLPMRPAQLAMEATGRLGLTPFGPYHWIMYGRSMWFDTTKAQTELGWEPRWSNSEMFADSYDWFLGHRGQPGGGSTHRRPAREGALAIARAGIQAIGRI
ncbi:MAG: NAD-dependent epimerase/dehydratase family protein [Acidobacteria bacterium]|nr:NAD-dependent epimerase/dehydratase family protein [Acidobacteriota bacterium]